MKILFAASECAPFAKVGGLADVVGTLPKFLEPAGINVSVILPFYGAMGSKGLRPKVFQRGIPVIFQGREEKFDLWKTFLPGSRVPLYLVKKDKYFGRGGIYLEADASSGGSAEEAARFFFLSLAAIKTARLLKIDILHCHDWHTAAIPFLLKKIQSKNEIKTLLTVHNLDYQGVYWEKIVNGLLGTDFQMTVNCLNLGIIYSDFVSTVSPAYAQEILTEGYGAGLEKFLRKKGRRFAGILNGLDYGVFSPQTDRLIAENYSIQNLERKIANKTRLQKKCFGKSDPAVPFLGVVSRLARQKGIGLIEKTFPDLMKKNLRLVLLGVGLPVYGKFFRENAKKHPDKFWSEIAFDEKLAHEIYAASDIFLMPSAYEPCGLGQQIAMRYGTVPVARATGGIKDTVISVGKTEADTPGTGFIFEKYDSDEFLSSIEKALDVYSNKKDVWKKIQQNGMKGDYSWDRSVGKYKLLYQDLIKD
jgi:starch synthase